jgi:transposase-like protein
MPRTRPPYSPEFRRQMVDLVRAGRNPDDLAGEFEPSGHSIRAWVAQADRNEGRREVGRRCPSPIRYCGDVDQAKSGVVGLT